MAHDLRLDFLSAAKEPYADGNRRIFVSDAPSLAADKTLLAACKDPDSTILFPDNLPGEKILAELDALAELAPQKLARLSIKGHIGNDRRFTFDDNVKGFHPLPDDYPHLMADLERTQRMLSPAFNEWHRVSLKRFLPEQSNSDQWHKDFYTEPETIFASRTFGPRGTMIATGEIRADETYEFPSLRSGPFKVASAAHAGQGIYLFHGGTVHGIPQITEGRRWVYIFS